MKIGYRTVEQVAVASVWLFVLVSGNFWLAMGRLCKALSAMEQFIQANQAPFIANKSGEVKHGRTEHFAHPTPHHSNSGASLHKVGVRRHKPIGSLVPLSMTHVIVKVHVTGTE